MLHWGATLGKLNPVDLRRALQEGIPHADLDIYQNPGVWREGARGYLGRPAVLGHRNGVDWSQQFDIVDVKSSGNTLSVKSSDVRAALEVTVNFELSAPGILRISQTITNLGAESFSLGELTTWLPLPDYISETVDFTGRWVKERQPQRREIQVGTWAREIREGRSGHDYTIVQLAMTKDADYQRGEVFSLGLQWSGNTRHLVERQPTGRTTMGAGEGEVAERDVAAVGAVRDADKGEVGCVGGVVDQGAGLRP